MFLFFSPLFLIMPKYLREILGMPRYKLLYYFYKHKKVKDEVGLKSKIKKIIGYSSDGHMYSDLERLEKDGMISKEGDYWKVTNKGKFEFFHLELLKFLAIILVS